MAMVASFGGLLNTGAGVPSRSRRRTGPVDVIPKKSYALALDEQIATRKAQEGAGDDSDGAAFQGNPFVNDDGATPAGDRIMGVRHGGPMAPVSKEAYAAQLKEQMEGALRARRAAVEARSASVPAAPGGAGGDPQAVDLRGKRCAGPMTPATKDSKASYARDLQLQMAARAQRQDAAASAQSEDTFSDLIAKDEVARGTGKRRMVQTEPIDKQAYAFDLLRQMQENEAARHARRAEDTAKPSHPGHKMLGGDESRMRRGRRHESNITATSKDGYTQALQDQIAEREAEKAANAFHLQEAPAYDPAAVGSDAPAQGKRLTGPMAPVPKNSYAALLKDQITERQMQRAAERVSDHMPVERTFGRHASAETPRGRRHHSQMAPVSKQCLALALQDQMAARDAQRATEAFHVRAPSPSVGGGGLVPTGSEHPEKGRRHVPPPAPVSKQLYARSLEDQIYERDAQRATDVPRDLKTSTREASAAAAVAATAAAAAASASDATGAMAQTGGATSKFARSGAALMGLSGTEGKRVTFRDDEGFDAEAHERAMVAKVVRERADVLERMLSVPVGDASSP